MLQEILDLREEGDALYAVLQTMDERHWDTVTQFKSWTIHDVVLHLHFSDYLAITTARDRSAFSDVLAALLTAMGEGQTLMQYSRDWIEPISGADLLVRWRNAFVEMCDLFASLDPQTRLEWFGPDMGLRMFATARQMETWAHGQEIYDLLGLVRQNTDRLKNIVVIGLKTFAWTFINRGLTPPASPPYLRLEAPSGAIWEWGQPSDTYAISGTAEAFAQVVTQTRNVADTSLQVIGEDAKHWMSIAQCFAGPPADPPAPNTRFRHT